MSAGEADALIHKVRKQIIVVVYNHYTINRHTQCKHQNRNKKQGCKQEQMKMNVKCEGGQGREQGDRYERVW